jgi:hypothetical protein
MAAWDSFRRLFHPRRILWQNRSGFYCMGLEQFCPISVVACLDDSREYDLIERRTGIRFCCLERHTGRRTRPDESAIEEILPRLGRQIGRLLEEPGRDHWAIVCPLPCQTLSAFAASSGYESACHPSELGNWLSHKANFFSGLEGLDLPRMRGRWTRLSETRYAELCSELGSGFVAQLAVGSSGSGTVFIRSETDYALAGARLADAPVWVAPDLGNLSLNINAIAMAASVVAGYPSVQLAGLEMLSSAPGMYCGNDYSAAAGLPPSALEEVSRQTERIGQWLVSLGYRGLFGLDFVFDPATWKAFAVDLNPRWQGSTALLTQAEWRAGRLPLAAAELAYRLGVLEEAEIRKRQEAFFQPVRAAQMSLRWHRPGWWKVTGELEPGVYSVQPQVRYLRPGASLNDCGAPEEILVTGGAPRRGVWIGPGAHLLRVYSEQPVMDLDRMTPLAWSQSAARELYRRLALEPVE